MLLSDVIELLNHAENNLGKFNDMAPFIDKAAQSLFLKHKLNIKCLSKNNTEVT